jgi:RNA polymerase sigma-70 factor, ECF subfamily
VTSQPDSRPALQAATITRFPAEKRSDTALVADAAQGDRAAIATIWDRYSSLVRGVLYGALPGDPMVEDLVQEVFVAFIRGASRIQDGAALRGYLAGMAVRQAAQEIRRRKVRRIVGLSPTGELPERSTLPVDLVNRERLAALHRVLSKLSERRKMAFILRQVQGLEILEVAAALNTSESTLRRELNAANESIRRAGASEPALAELLSLSHFGTDHQGSWS